MTNTKIFGYIRVSSKDQNELRQKADILNEGIDERDIYIDKLSGKDFDRPQYQLLKRNLREGDLLYIHSIDRFGRNSREILKEWKDITEFIKADIKVMDMPLLDTTQYKDTLGTFVSDLVLQVLSFVAERERENINKRQKEGILLAKKEGKHLGRPKLNLDTLSNVQKETLEMNYGRWKAGGIKGVEFMELLDLKKNSFYKIIKQFEEQQR
ncbi:recombinase family protein [Halobacillus yeomjeoni]|uniref:Recombinase family protein n=1 Tax=Halobacillus yeomjeoni TaxID=311194 RepID=A0A931HTS6_9BACI|nr:recombinase family protein [Halobacillus yeomjeoni]MBH0229537.1 recombinase family protein [Halobacillus yeomjeoni]